MTHAAPVPEPAGHRDIVVVGGSAGGIQALQTFVAGLPADLDAAILVVIHVSPHAPSSLPAILNRAGALPAAHAADAEPIRRGRIYVAPPDRQMVLRDERIHLTRGPRENGHRPAIDPLFRSAALNYGPRVVGVILSGSLDDGTAGLEVIHRAGGVTFAQSDPLHADMPQNAIDAVDIDHVVPVADLPGMLTRVVQEQVDAQTISVPIADDPDAPGQLPEQPREATGLTCPECGGVLWLVGDEPLRFRCRVGHAYGAESLLAHQGEALETALWIALRSLEERVAFLDRMAKRFSQRGDDRHAHRYREDADTISQRAELVRRALYEQEEVRGEKPPIS